MPPEVPSWLSDLNPEQLSAVTHDRGNLLILAGAGSGKTRVIVAKIAWLIRERGFEPESILAVTFTNKAAREMRERACAIESACSRAMLRTFHSFGAWFLRRNAAAAGLGLGSDFIIYDDDDSTTLAHAAFPELSRQECSRFSSQVARAKDFGLRPDSAELDARFGDRNFRRRYAEYERRLRGTGNVDFGDLIELPARILESDPDIRRRTHQRFRVILVDEYQDSNVAQFRLLRELAGDGAYVCVVGDDDQSIYAFRGAEVRNILDFPERFPGTDVVRLERNYRSFQSILSVAQAVVERNEGRLGKVLKAVRAGGGPPKLALLADQDEETAYCVKVIDAHIRKGGSFSDIAILYRTNAQSLAFEKAFPGQGIPYRLVGALRFYEREEVKDTLALLAITANPRDEVAFRRIVNKPSRGIGEASMEAIVSAAIASGTDLMSAARDSGSLVRTAKGRAGLAAFDALVRGLALRFGTEPSLAAIVERGVKESGLLEYHRGQDAIAGTQKVANLDELVNAAADYPATGEGLALFLETIELDRSMAMAESQGDAVTLITMHNTKGLEFPLVIVTGMDQGLFPRDDDRDGDLEEQRRLFYVSITRAMDELHLTTCRRRLYRGRYMESTPSRFLGEIPGSLFETSGGSLDASIADPESARWKPGLRVYHDDHGSGSVVLVKPAGDSGVCVAVRFETGKTLQFFPKFTKKLEPLGD